MSECHLVYIWDAFNRCSLNVDFTVSKLEWSEGGGGGGGIDVGHYLTPLNPLAKGRVFDQ